MECHLASSVSGPRQPSLASSCFGRASFSLFWTVSYCLLSYSGAASALVILEMCLPPQLRILSTPWIQSMRVSLLKIGPSQKRGQGSTAFNNTSTTLQQHFNNKGGGGGRQWRDGFSLSMNHLYRSPTLKLDRIRVRKTVTLNFCGIPHDDNPPNGRKALRMGVRR